MIAGAPRLHAGSLGPGQSRAPADDDAPKMRGLGKGWELWHWGMDALS